MCYYYYYDQPIISWNNSSSLGHHHLFLNTIFACLSVNMWPVPFTVCRHLHVGHINICLDAYHLWVLSCNESNLVEKDIIYLYTMILLIQKSISFANGHIKEFMRRQSLRGNLFLVGIPTHQLPNLEKDLSCLWFRTL